MTTLFLVLWGSPPPRRMEVLSRPCSRSRGTCHASLFNSVMDPDTVDPEIDPDPEKNGSQESKIETKIMRTSNLIFLKTGSGSKCTGAITLPVRFIYLLDINCCFFADRGRFRVRVNLIKNILWSILQKARYEQMNIPFPVFTSIRIFNGLNSIFR